MYTYTYIHIYVNFIFETLDMLENDLQQVTTLLSFVGGPGIETMVGIVATLSVSDSVGLSERTNTLCIVS